MSMLTNYIYKKWLFKFNKDNIVNFSLSICEFNQFWQLLCSFVLHRKCILKTWIRTEAYSKRPRGKLAYDMRQKTLCLDLLINGIKTILTSLKTSVFVHLRDSMSFEGRHVIGWSEKPQSVIDSNTKEAGSQKWQEWLSQSFWPKSNITGLSCLKVS